MFSREDVATYVNRNFEPAWEMVRPVPIITLDFGNGHTATRTLHGNVASYVCCNDGEVVDVLPGMYTPAVFMMRRLRVESRQRCRRHSTSG